MLGAEADERIEQGARRGLRLRRASSWLTVAILALGGCSRAPELAFVDLNQVPVQELAVSPDGFTDRAPRLEATEWTIKAIPGGVILTQDAQGRTDVAVQRLREQQERAHRRLMARLRAVYQAEVDRLGEQQRAALEAQLREAEAGLSEEARALFEQSAIQIGLRRIELARLVDHPDPDPRSLRAIPDPEGLRARELGRALRARELARAAELRREISALKEGFRIAKFALYEQVQNAYRQQLTEDLARSLELQALREIEAEAEAARWLLETQAFIPVADLSKPVEAAAVEQAQAKTPPSERWTTPRPTPSPPVRGEDVYRLAKMFVSLRGYRWSEEPGVGADLTEEFLAWIDRDPNGP